MSCGINFMAKLRLIYPHADTLCEKDFEWLFDCPETKQFLEWFCSTVGEENVLSPAEVDAYEALLAAGKPILESDALEEALQLCCQDLQLPSSRVVEGPSQEALQQELQELKHRRDCQLWRYRKLLALTNKLQQEQKYLEEEEKVVKQELRMAHMDLKAKIFKTRAVLSQVSKAAKQVSESPGNIGMSQLPTLLCQMDLAPYLEQEQQATDAFETFIQQVLPESKTSMPKNLGTDEDELLEDQDSFWKELGQIETAHICARREVIVTAAKVEGARAALEWAQRTLEALEDNQVGQCPHSSTILYIAHTLAQRLPPLLQAEARRLCLPVLHRHFSLQVARLQDTARRQEEAAAWLLSQHSRLDLLELQLKRERKELEHKAAWLEKIETITRESQTRLQKQQIYFRGASPSQKGHPPTWIDPKDLTALIQQLIIMQDDLYEKLTDLLSDLEVKRRSLENPTLQAERSLYVHFYCNEDRLRQEVEELEKQATASSKRPPRELPYGRE
uniref:HAUS augmin-like complex subunit 3 N-terminal domain-containing protein n=1 Tax=Serinus canaria TaxID=9135 RepID=A0A8C9NY50_SERCA